MLNCCMRWWFSSLMCFTLNCDKYPTCVLQVESGFFLDCDVKIVGKSIRDRVALIKWRRERTVSTNGHSETGVKKMHQNLLQVPGTSVPQGAALATADHEDQETLICTVPVTTSVTCKQKKVLHFTLTTENYIQPTVKCIDSFWNFEAGVCERQKKGDDSLWVTTQWSNQTSWPSI